MGEVIRLLTDLRAERAMTLEEHLARYGRLADRPDPEALIQTVASSGLRGRGGADFPVATKMASVRAGRRGRVVVANGAEGEPASAKDKLLMSFAPHLVIDGAVLAAHAVGASEVVLCVADGAAKSLVTLERALGERAARRLDAVPLTLVRVEDAYISGEESALIQQLGGGPAKPTLTPPLPSERGVRGRPTLVQNVETLAHLAQVCRYGAEWFRQCGTTEDPGTALMTISGAVEHPGVYEIECGTPAAEAIAVAGGLAEEAQALLVGGYFGAWHPLPDGLDLSLAHSRLRELGFSLGSGVVVALPRAVCGMRESARIASWFSAESSGQCGPCVHGLAALAEVFEELGRPRARRGQAGWVERWSSQIAGRGACHHPDGAIRFLRSALETFGEELALHESGRCSALDGRALLPVPRPRELAVR